MNGWNLLGVMAVRKDMVCVGSTPYGTTQGKNTSKSFENTSPVFDLKKICTPGEYGNAGCGGKGQFSQAPQDLPEGKGVWLVDFFSRQWSMFFLANFVPKRAKNAKTGIFDRFWVSSLSIYILKLS